VALLSASPARSAAPIRGEERMSAAPFDTSRPVPADDEARVKRLLAVCRSLRAVLASAEPAAPVRVVDDPLLLGYVFGAVAVACEWHGSSACDLREDADLNKAALLKLAFEEVLAGPELVLDALLRTWRWEGEPSFALGRELGRADAAAPVPPSLQRLATWLARPDCRPPPPPRSGDDGVRPSASRSAPRRRAARGFGAPRSRPCRC
jgi:hypothetical protein